MPASLTAKCMAVQGRRLTPSLFCLGPSCTSFQSPNPPEKEMNPTKVLRPDSVESFKGRDSSFSAGTERHSLQDITWSQRPSKTEPGEGPLSPQPQRRKSPGKKLQFHLSMSSLLVSRIPSSLEQTNPARSPARSVLREQEQQDKQHHSTSQEQGKKVGFWVSRVQGKPKPPRQCWSHNEPSAGDLQRVCHQLMGDSTGESPKGRGCPGTSLPPPSSCGEEQPTRHCYSGSAHRPATLGPSCWEQDTPMCQQQGWPQGQAVPGLYDPCG